jgi:hypothetical protein
MASPASVTAGMASMASDTSVRTPVAASFCSTHSAGKPQSHAFLAERIGAADRAPPESIAFERNVLLEFST